MDTISNLLTIIRNGYAAGKLTVLAPYSQMSEKILEILVKEGFLDGVRLIKDNNFKKFEIQLKYQGKNSAITKLVRVSKPGRRIYRGVRKIPKTFSGLGITIVSTPGGIMTDKEALSKNLGGEIICQVW